VRQGHYLVFTERCLPRRPKDKGLQQTRRPFHLHAFQQQRYLRRFKLTGWSFDTDRPRSPLGQLPERHERIVLYTVREAVPNTNNLTDLSIQRPSSNQNKVTSSHRP